MAYEALRFYSRRDLTFRFVSNVDSTDFVEATRDLEADETLFIVSSKTFGTLETMTNARSARQWALERLGAKRRSPSTSSPCRPTRSASPSSASTPPTCSASGTGSAAATRWTRRSACRRCWPSGPSSFEEMLGGFHALDEHFRTAPLGAEPAGAAGPVGRLVRRLLRRAELRRDALRAVPEALPGLPAAADDGVQRQARAPRRLARRLRDRRRLLGRARHQRAAQLLPAHPSGHEAHPGRPHRLRQAAQSARRSPRHADVERVRAGRGAGLRQDRGRGAAPKERRRRSCRTG